MRRSPAPDLAVLRPSLEAVLRTEDMPGISLAVALGAEPALVLRVGCDAMGHELAPQSLSPVASVPKLATALAVLRLVEAGHLALDAPPGPTHLPEAAAARPGVTLRALLSHTAGLPLDLPDGAAPYRRGFTWRALAAACLLVPLEREPGTYVEYSNLGPGLLAVIVERTIIEQGMIFDGQDTELAALIVVTRHGVLTSHVQTMSRLGSFVPDHAVAGPGS